MFVFRGLHVRVLGLFDPCAYPCSGKECFESGVRRVRVRSDRELDSRIARNIRKPAVTAMMLPGS